LDFLGGIRFLPKSFGHAPRTESNRTQIDYQLKD
jgi:hypothetical protein